MTVREIAIYEAGIAEGIKQMEAKIQAQWERGKPIFANGRLWWIKSDLDNLNDIMDDIQTTWEEEHGIEWKK